MTKLLGRKFHCIFKDIIQDQSISNCEISDIVLVAF